MGTLIDAEWLGIMQQPPPQDRRASRLIPIPYVAWFLFAVMKTIGIQTLRIDDWA